MYSEDKNVYRHVLTNKTATMFFLKKLFLVEYGHALMIVEKLSSCLLVAAYISFFEKIKLQKQHHILSVITWLPG